MFKSTSENEKLHAYLKAAWSFTKVAKALFTDELFVAMFWPMGHYETEPPIKKPSKPIALYKLVLKSTSEIRKMSQP